MDSLNQGQRKIYDIVVSQRLSAFYGGEAGTGKTHVADVMIAALIAQGVNVCVCASTGQAAQHLEEGFTAHMLFGLRPAKTKGGPSQRAGFWAMKKALEVAEVIFVDEISMLPDQLWVDMNDRLCQMRGTNKPFGGVQIVALGDFLQLPPVEGRFCFHSELFAATFDNRCFRLTQQMRQGEDLAFARMLAQLRVGECPYGVKSALMTRLFAEECAPPPSEVTYLYCRRDQVEQKNAACLDSLPSEKHEWNAQDWKLGPQYESALKSCILEDKLVLKIGAPVLLRKNVDARRRLVNGTRGRVVGFATLRESGKATTCSAGPPTHEEAPRLDDVEVLGEVQAHLGLLPIVEFNGTPYAVGMTRIEKHRGSQSEGRKRKSDDDDAPPVEGRKGELIASRTQIPLTLAFALTVHKAQGMTLPKVCFAWNNTFDNGQIYVALSRVRQLNDVYIISNYVPVNRIRAAADAIEFEKKHVQALQ